MSDPQCGSGTNTLCKTFLTRGQAIGLVIISEVGILSVVAVLILFAMMIKNAIRHFQSHPRNRWRQIKSPLEVYMLSLFIADLMQGVGIAMDVRWVAEGTVTCGGYCTAQGVIQQLGETIVAMSTLAIAVHTFVIILFRRAARAVLFATFIVSLIWVFVILFVAISASLHTRGNAHFDTPTPYWCWVGPNFIAARIAGEYFWFWFTGLLSLVLYVILFFCLRGNIETEDKRWWKIHFLKRPKVVRPSVVNSQEAGQTAQIPDSRSQDSKGAAKEAFMMLLYPVCYVGLILPLSIVRWIDFILQAHYPNDDPNAHRTIPSALTIVAQSIFALSGIVNVTLLLCTRPGILLLGETPERPARGPVFDTPRGVHAGEDGRDRSALTLRPFISMRNAGDEGITVRTRPNV